MIFIEIFLANWPLRPIPPWLWGAHDLTIEVKTGLSILLERTVAESKRFKILPVLWRKNLWTVKVCTRACRSISGFY